MVLIGARGSGKSAVGAVLAGRLGLTFIDLDLRIAAEFGCSIRDVFLRHGEPAFRRVEREALAKAMTESASSGSVIASGAGAVVDPANQDVIRRADHVVWLCANIETLRRRLSADPATPTSRPRLTGDDPDAELEDKLTERAPVYAALATMSVNTDARDVAAVADDIARDMG
jgi:shikimate kinase